MRIRILFFCMSAQSPVLRTTLTDRLSIIDFLVFTPSTPVLKDATSPSMIGLHCRSHRSSSSDPAHPIQSIDPGNSSDTHEPGTVRHSEPFTGSG